LETAVTAAQCNGHGGGRVFKKKNGAAAE
jgi:hypothetical protein